MSDSFANLFFKIIQLLLDELLVAVDETIVLLLA